MYICCCSVHTSVCSHRAMPHKCWLTSRPLSQRPEDGSHLELIPVLDALSVLTQCSFTVIAMSFFIYRLNDNAEHLFYPGYDVVYTPIGKNKVHVASSNFSVTNLPLPAQMNPGDELIFPAQTLPVREVLIRVTQTSRRHTGRPFHPQPAFFTASKGGCLFLCRDLLWHGHCVTTWFAELVWPGGLDFPRCSAPSRSI